MPKGYFFKLVVMYLQRYDLPGWSLKYNMVFQNILDMDIFPSTVMEMELNYYMEQLHPWGIPLDVRRWGE